MDEDEKKQVNDVVEDTDADTRDIEDTERQDYSDMSERLSRMEETINRMASVVNSMQKASANIVDMGGVIRENESTSTTDADDGFVPLEKLDFTI